MRVAKLYTIVFVLLLFTISCLFALAQTDSPGLLNKWQKATKLKDYRKDTGNTILLNKLSQLYLYNNTDSAVMFAKQAQELAISQKYALGEAISWYNLGSVYYVSGNYTGSLEASDKLMTISRKINYGTGIGGASRLAGLIYLAQDRYNDALVEFTKALKVTSPLGEDVQTGKTYFDIGICYDESKRSEKAFYYFNKTIEIGKQIKNGDLVDMATNRMGEAWFHLKNYDKALAYYQQVADSKSASNWEKDFSYSGLGQTWYALKVYDKAVLNAKKSLELAQKINSQWDVARALGILADSYAGLKDYKNAYTYQHILKHASDSLFNSDKEKEINYLALKQQRADNILLKNDLKTKEESITFSRRLFYIRNFIAVIFVVFVIFIIRSNRLKTRLNNLLREQKEEIFSQKESLNELNSTKDKLFSVISHDLRSPFTSIIQTMGLIRSGDVPVEEQDMILEDFYQQVNLDALMMNNLLVWASSQQSGIKANLIDVDITDTINSIISVSNFFAKNKNITLYHNYDGEKRVIADPDHIKIIIQNLIGNAIKFTPNGGAIEIYYSEQEGYQIVHVKDSGIGMSAEKLEKLFKVTGKDISGYGTNNEVGAGIGLALIKQFADANKGKLNVKSKPGGGSEFEVWLKKAIV